MSGSIAQRTIMYNLLSKHLQCISYSRSSEAEKWELSVHRIGCTIGVLQCYDPSFWDEMSWVNLIWSDLVSNKSNISSNDFGLSTVPKILAQLGLFAAPCCSLPLHAAPCSYFWLLSVPFSSFWILLASFGYLWLLSAPFSSFQLLLAPSVSFWLIHW